MTCMQEEKGLEILQTPDRKKKKRGGGGRVIIITRVKASVTSIYSII